MKEYDAVELENMPDADGDVDANEPLIVGESDEQEQDRDPGLGHYGKAHISLKSAGRVVWVLTLSAGISGLLFGYDTGVISSTLVSIGEDLSNRPLTTLDKSLITAITSLFALLSAPTTGYLADKYGRRCVILVANLLFILGSIIQAASAYVPMMIVGRAAVGAAVGLASCATPLYITEVAPAAMRGRLVTIQSLFITGGQVVAYLIGWAFAYMTGGWRWMVGLGAVPAVVQLFLLAQMFETPRWLVKTEQQQKAQIVLQKVYGGLDEDERRVAVQSVLTSIETEIAEEAKITHPAVSGRANGSDIWSTAQHLVRIPGNRRALTIACMLQALQQLCGFNSLMYFSATIFAMVGFGSPIGASLSVALTNFVFTVIAFKHIDTVGRRNILLRSIPFMVIGLVGASVAFIFVYVAPNDDTPVYSASGSPLPALLLINMILYVAAYAIGLGCVPWQQSELFPLRVRGLGSGIATATNWTSNFVIGISFLPMMEFLGPFWTFMLYAVVCVVGWVGVWCIYPETAGLELEGIGELLKDGWGVRKSVQAFRERRSIEALVE